MIGFRINDRVGREMCYYTQIIEEHREGQPVLNVLTNFIYYLIVFYQKCKHRIH